MNEHEEVIFNLFLIEFMQDYCEVRIKISVYDYSPVINLPAFKMLKDCFPENEVCVRRSYFNYHYDCEESHQCNWIVGDLL